MNVVLLHIITSLRDGGAQSVLFKLCNATPNYRHIIFCLTKPSKYSYAFVEKGFEVYHFPLSFFFLPLNLFKLFIKARRVNPSLIQSWMYHADFIASLLGLFYRIPVLWNIRHSTLSFRTSSFSTFLLALLLGSISHWFPKRIVCCSSSAADYHINRGYCSSKFTIIYNGYELPKEIMLSSINNFRTLHQISSSTFTLGMVARFDPQKDHDSLFCALSNFSKSNFSFKLILAGTCMNLSNSILVESLKRYELFSNTILLGPIDFVPLLMSALDVHILSSSYGEAFPNVLAESMLCKTPCISTDVGESSVIIGDSGWIVPPSSPSLLAYAIKSAYNEKYTSSDNWYQRGEFARSRIMNLFSLESMSAQYISLWDLHRLK